MGFIHIYVRVSHERSTVCENILQDFVCSGRLQAFHFACMQYFQFKLIQYLCFLINKKLNEIVNASGYLRSSENCSYRLLRYLLGRFNWYYDTHAVIQNVSHMGGCLCKLFRFQIHQFTFKNNILLNWRLSQTMQMSLIQDFQAWHCVTNVGLPS